MNPYTKEERRLNRIRTPLVVMLLLGLIAAVASGVSAQGLTDIEGNWARSHIESLVARGIVNGYPDKTFRPERPVTRAEFAKMVTTAFFVEPEQALTFNDVSGHWARGSILTLAGAGIVEGYPDGTFRPDAPITRAEAVAALVRILKLHDVKGFTEGESFADVSRSHWAFDSIEVALRLKMLPPYLRGTFGPAVSANRAEVAAMIDEALRLQIARGTLDYLEKDARVLGVRSETGVRDFTVIPEAIIYRNTNVVPLENVVVGDAVYVVADRFGSPQFVKANGVVTQQDVAAKVLGITQGLLTPSDLQSIIRGDWKALGESLQNTIYNQLVERGLTPVEASAIMTQDWDSLKEHAKERVAQVIAAQLGVTSDLAYALLARDWELARELAQAEAVQHLLGQLFVDPNMGA